MAGVLNEANIKNALKQVRECQEQLVVLDRSHGIKVQQIQKEYQDFMEKIRAKAQGAIDTANRDYQGAKTLLSGRMSIMVDYLQAQIPLLQLQHAAQQIQRAAQQAAHQQQGGNLPAALQQHFANIGEDPAATGAALKASSLAVLMNDPTGAAAASSGGGMDLPRMHQQSHASQAPGAPSSSGGGGESASGGMVGAATASLASASALGGLTVPALADLVHAIARGQVPLEQIPEPLRSQLTALFTSGNAAAMLGGGDQGGSASRPTFPAPDALQLPASSSAGPQLQASGASLIPLQTAALKIPNPSAVAVAAATAAGATSSQPFGLGAPSNQPKLAAARQQTGLGPLSSEGGNVAFHVMSSSLPQGGPLPFPASTPPNMQLPLGAPSPLQYATQPGGGLSGQAHSPLASSADPVTHVAAGAPTSGPGTTSGLGLPHPGQHTASGTSALAATQRGSSNTGDDTPSNHVHPPRQAALSHPPASAAHFAQQQGVYPPYASSPGIHPLPGRSSRSPDMFPGPRPSDAQQDSTLQLQQALAGSWSGHGAQAPPGSGLTKAGLSMPAVAPLESRPIAASTLSSAFVASAQPGSLPMGPGIVSPFLNTPAQQKNKTGPTTPFEELQGAPPQPPHASLQPNPPSQAREGPRGPPLGQLGNLGPGSQAAHLPAVANIVTTQPPVGLGGSAGKGPLPPSSGSKVADQANPGSTASRGATPPPAAVVESLSPSPPPPPHMASLTHPTGRALEPSVSAFAPQPPLSKPITSPVLSQPASASTTMERQSSGAVVTGGPLPTLRPTMADPASHQHLTQPQVTTEVSRGCSSPLPFDAQAQALAQAEPSPFYAQAQAGPSPFDAHAQALAQAGPTGVELPYMPLAPNPAAMMAAAAESQNHLTHQAQQAAGEGVLPAEEWLPSPAACALKHQPPVGMPRQASPPSTAHTALAAAAVGQLPAKAVLTTTAAVAAQPDGLPSLPIDVAAVQQPILNLGGSAPSAGPPPNRPA
eukprot:gene23658-9189_t